jgi:hypothetical protein
MSRLRSTAWAGSVTVRPFTFTLPDLMISSDFRRDAMPLVARNLESLSVVIVGRKALLSVFEDLDSLLRLHLIDRCDYLTAAIHALAYVETDRVRQEQRVDPDVDKQVVGLGEIEERLARHLLLGRIEE